MKRSTLLSLFFSAFLISTGLSAQDQNITFRSKLSFPDQTVANMSGWAAPSGAEYALVGASKGLIIVDVTNPDAPVEIVQIPGPNSLWKEIKTYGHYAYVVTEGGEGVQIVDLSALPSPNVPVKNYKGDGLIAGDLNTIHALHIDLKKGFLYAYGSNLFFGGAVVLDLVDPWNPKYVGKFDDLGYIHDGYVDNDTMYAGHINIGLFSIVDMTNKAAPVLLNTQTTPNFFTHNTWLSEDRKTLFTTDETSNSFLASYDVSDPLDIQFLDKQQTAPGSGSIGHNTHILGNYAITAWYTQGVTIVDVTNPQNLVETGKFDTYAPSNGNGFDGCWGVYPYLPSGNFVVGNIGPGELWVLTPNYKRAAYLEGKITNTANGQAISGAKVQIVGNNNSIKYSSVTGIYRTGQTQTGPVQVTISKFGYYPVTVPATLATGAITILDQALTPIPSYTVAGQVLRADNSEPIPFAHVAILSVDTTYESTADANGVFSFSNIIERNYDIVAGIWGFRYKVLNQNVNANQQLVLKLDKGYQDDFVFEYGWEKSGTSAQGIWERTAHPLGIDVGIVLAPSADFSGDVGYSCYVTGNSSTEVDVDDVESGTSILTSPVMNLTNYPDPRVTAQAWCLSTTGNLEFLDSIKVYISNGLEEKLAWERVGDDPNWHLVQFDITDFVPVTNTMRIRVVCFDNPDGVDFDSYEAAFDRFRITGVTVVGTEELNEASWLSVMPNPFTESTLLQFEPLENEAQLGIFDLAGKLVQNIELAPGTQQVKVGAELPNGVYWVRMDQNGQTSAPQKLIKLN